MIYVTICIPSIGRPSLKQTLASVCNLDVKYNITTRIMVADDSPDNSASILIRNQGLDDRVECIHVASQNISRARNACLEHATGEFIAFIDDDEVADAGWVQNLVRCALLHHADVAFGLVRPRYPADTPLWMIKARLYEKLIPKSGTKLTTGSTANAIIRKSFLTKHKLKFDEKFGRDGGEDTDFFHRVYLTGGILISCAEAIVFHEVAEERISDKYIKDRCLRNGRNYAQIYTSGLGIVHVLFFYGSALSKLIVATLVLLAFYYTRRDLSFRAKLKYWHYKGYFNNLLNNTSKRNYS